MFDLQLKGRLNESVVILMTSKKEALAKAPCQQSSSQKNVTVLI